MDAVQLDIFANDSTARPWLLAGIGEGVMNDHDVYVDNVLKFLEGKLSRTYVEIKMCRVGEFILYEFDYMTGCGYGSESPLGEPCFKCHRNNGVETLANAIYDTFVHSVLGYDRNIRNAGNSRELQKLCRKACDRIATEVA